MNQISIIGKMGQDPDMKTSGGGKEYVNFSVAVKAYGDKPANWFRCSAFGKTAEIIGKYVKKGDTVGISGSIEFGEYEKDGVKVSSTTLMVRDVTLCSSGKAPSQESAPAKAKAQVQEYDPFAGE